MNMIFAHENFASSKLYPIVDSFTWIEKLLPLGVSTIQLRIKNKELDVEHEVKQSIELAKIYQARLYINDYWQLAIRYQAYGVHLGQEDLNSADVNAIYQSGLHLGISTHNHDEINRAQSIKPSYLAIGPIFPTNSKIMPFLPQGIEKLSYWCQTLNYPLVAIGGINLTNINQVMSTNVNAIAMISAITQSVDPIQTTKLFLDLTKK